MKKIIPPPPRYEKKLPTIYAPDQAGLVIEAGDASLRLVMSLALKCGLREQELMHVQHSDIDQHAHVIRVQNKPEWNFEVKDSEQRDITVEDVLLAELNSWHQTQPHKKLMFGTKKDRPNGHLLRALKRAARKAGLNCNRCVGCRGKAKECRDYDLHEFRRTYITTLLRNGVDLATVQRLAGHSDLESTMRYLRPAAANEIRAKINAIQWTS